MKQVVLVFLMALVLVASVSYRLGHTHGVRAVLTCETDAECERITNTSVSLTDRFDTTTDQYPSERYDYSDPRFCVQAHIHRSWCENYNRDYRGSATK